MPRLTDHLFRLADVLLSTVTDGEVRLKLGSHSEGIGEAPNVPHFGTDGFVSCPNDANDSGACVALEISDGQQKFCVGQVDNRYSSKAGTLTPGDRAIVSSSAARVLLKNAKAAVSIITENAEDDGSTMMIDVRGATGTVQIVNGGSYVEMKKDSIVLSAGGSMLVIDATGVAVFGPHFGGNTASGNLGVVGGIAPPPGVNSVLTGPTGLTAIPAKSWTISPL